MNDTSKNVRIKLIAIGTREEKVLLVLSKIQGLIDTPEQLVATVPCYISKEVSLLLAQQVQGYLKKAGATVEIEDSGTSAASSSSGETQEEFSSVFESPGYDVTSFESSEAAPPAGEFGSDAPEDAIGEFPTEILDSVSSPPTARLRRKFDEDEDLNEPIPRRRRERKKKRSLSDFSGLAAVIVVVMIVSGIIWLYFSGTLSNLSKNIRQNPMVGVVGVLEIENESEAELSLHHIIGTRVFEQVPLQGQDTRLERGDYYVEARKGGQILRYPVLIEGRGHRVRINVVFPETLPPLPDTVYIPPGWFRIGNKETTVAHFGFPDEKPDIDVYVSGFFLSRYEVTNREFVGFIEDEGYDNELYWTRLIREWPSLVAQVPEYGKVYGNEGWQSVRKYIHKRLTNTDDLPGPRLWEEDTPPYEYGQDDHPVLGVSLYEAEAYCKWRTQQTGKIHRLPTEAEWEKAARGYEGYFFSYGNEYDAARANTEGGNTRKVGSYPPNGYGLYDMTGNVWEWISDHYKADAYHALYDEYRSEIRNPRIYDDTYNRCIVRGGSFRSVNRVNARNPVRYPMYPNYWHTNIGFRYVVLP